MATFRTTYLCFKVFKLVKVRTAAWRLVCDLIIIIDFWAHYSYLVCLLIEIQTLTDFPIPLSHLLGKTKLSQKEGKMTKKSLGPKS